MYGARGDSIDYIRDVENDRGGKNVFQTAISEDVKRSRKSLEKWKKASFPGKGQTRGKTAGVPQDGFTRELRAALMQARRVEARLLFRENIYRKLLADYEFGEECTKTALEIMLARELRSREQIASEIAEIKRATGEDREEVQLQDFRPQEERDDILEAYLWHIYGLLNEEAFGRSTCRRIVADSAYVIRKLCPDCEHSNKRQLFYETLAERFNLKRDGRICPVCGEIQYRGASFCFGCGERINNDT